MAIRIVEEKTTNPAAQEMFVVLAAPTREELEGTKVIDLAKQVAVTRGFSLRGLSDKPNIYPVDAKGETPDALLLGTVPVAEYWADFRLIGHLR